MSDERPVPAYAIWKGKRVRVLYYFGNNSFMVRQGGGNRLVRRDQITFIKDRKGKK